MFQIVLLDTTTKEVIPQVQFGQFPSGDEASAFVVNNLPPQPGKKYQPRPIGKDDDWRTREKARLEDGTYKPLPWADKVPPVPDHFAHVSVKNPEEVAFTRGEGSGRADRQARLPVAAYLRTFYPGLSIYERRIIISIHLGREVDPERVLFATTPDEIQQVYMKGPESCMSHSLDAYASSRHPVRAYGAGDLAVAYLEDEDGRVTHRSICWPTKKIYGRIYGHGPENLSGPLQEMGYSFDSVGFCGAKLLRIEDVGEDPEEEYCIEGFALPYVDFFPGLTDKNDHLVVDLRGNICAACTVGIVSYDDEEDWGFCQVCGEPVGTSQAGVCFSCLIEKGEACVITTSDYSLVSLADGRAINSNYVASHTVEHEGKLYLKREGIPQKVAA